MANFVGGINDRHGKFGFVWMLDDNVALVTKSLRVNKSSDWTIAVPRVRHFLSVFYRPLEPHLH
jgi:hypothetical protein